MHTTPPNSNFSPKKNKKHFGHGLLGCLCHDALCAQHIGNRHMQLFGSILLAYCEVETSTSDPSLLSYHLCWDQEPPKARAALQQSEGFEAKHQYQISWPWLFVSLQ